MNNTKFKKNISLLFAVIICLTAFMGFSTTTAFAAVGEQTDVYMVSYPREGDSNFNANWGHEDLNYMNGWKGLATNKTTLRAVGSYTGNIAYCIEPGTSQQTGDTLTEKGENFFNDYSSSFNNTISGDDVNLLIGRILEYGYCGKVSTEWKSQNANDADSMAHAIATQYLIWETIVGERDANFNHVDTGSCNAVLEAINSNHPLYSKVMSYYNSMVFSVQKHSKVPSFCAKSTSKAETAQLKWDGSKYSVTLTDSNGVLENYSFSANVSGVNFSANGNNLTISMETLPVGTLTVTATKNNSMRKGVIVWSDGKYTPGYGLQDVISYAQEINDPVQGFVNVKVGYGSCQIIKTSEDDIVDGVKFTVSGNGINETVTTANGGKIQIDNLVAGTYTITELTNDIYEPQKTQTVTVIEGQVAEVTFNNTLKRGNLRVVKSAEDNFVKGITFHLFGTSLSGTVIDEYAVTNENGIAIFENVLISGSTPYTLEEVDTDVRYVVPEKQMVSINWNEVTEIAIENKLIYGSVSGLKVDENGKFLDGAVIGIFKPNTTEYTTENAFMTAVSDENGSFSFEKVPYGSWVVREIKQPVGFILNEDVYEANIDKNGQVIEIKIVNENIRGNITLTKVDSEYPDNKLSGAVFEVYKDINENGVIDEVDELIGNLEETEIGVYQLNGLAYGKYLVKETKAPEGFLIDDGVYPVFVETDGITYTVENKAGVGFVNDAMKGTLKIVKTSSDGKVEGFAFRITGANGYDMTFETDENGEIIIEGLRVGEYQVSEVANKASSVYILPDDKDVTIENDSTVVVEMHNVFRDAPKTGDERNVGLWYVLAALSAVGIAVTSLLVFKKRK